MPWARAAVYTYKQRCRSRHAAEGCRRPSHALADRPIGEPVYAYKQRYMAPGATCSTAARAKSVDTHELQLRPRCSTRLAACIGSEVHAYRQCVKAIALPASRHHSGVAEPAKSKTAAQACTWRLVYAYKQLQSWSPGFSAAGNFSGSGGRTTATVSSRFSSAVANASRLSSGTAIETSKTSPRCL